MRRIGTLRIPTAGTQASKVHWRGSSGAVGNFGGSEVVSTCVSYYVRIISGGALSRPLEIRTAAIKLFYQRGYNATSLKEIGDVVQLRAPSLYNHIDSKQKLLQEIMFDGIDALTKDFDAAVAESDDVVEQIRLGAEALVRHNIRRQQQAYVNTYEIPSLEEPARTELIQQRRAYIDRWAALITRAVTEGAAFAPEPMLAAFNIIDMIAGLARWYRPDGRWSEDFLVTHYGRLALAILNARDKSAAVTRG